MWATPYIATAGVATLLALGVSPPSIDQEIGSRRILPKRTPEAALMGLLSALMLIGVAAIRWHVGADYWDYERGFKTRVSTPLSSLGLFDEPGLNILAKTGALFKDDPAMMFGLASVITIGLIVWTFYRSTEAFAAAILLFFLTSNWQNTFNGVRQSLAVAILFAGHNLIVRRSFKKYLLIVLLASLFHVSAIIFIALYWMPRKRLTLFQMSMLMIFSLIGLSAYDLVASIGDEVRGSGYTGGEYFVREINPIRLAVASGPILIYSAFSNKDALKSRDFLYVNIIFLNLAILIMSLNSAYIARYGLYTGVYVCLGIPAIINMENRSLRRLLYFATFSLYLIFWYYETTSNVNLLNFRTLWDRPQEWRVIP